MRNFDTLGSFESLKDVGVAEDQARVLVKMLEASINAGVENLTTKAELKADIAEVRSDISGLKSSMTLMQRLFFGGTLAILASNLLLFLHH
jgi:hypothetical protein